jgi:hypothetical protein
MNVEKDIPNEDFECNPDGECWCKQIKFPAFTNNSDICFSPREVRMMESASSKSDLTRSKEHIEAQK